jgi:rieske iron-sulfur protein
MGGRPGAPKRRTFLRTSLLAALLGAPWARVWAADTADEDAASERPQPGDLFVFAEGDNEGKIIAPDQVALDEEPVMAWPFDPARKIARDGSRLNQLLLLRLDPASLDEATRSRAADGIIAYSAICSHAGCPVTGWVEDEGKRVLKCFCHNSEYEPRQSSQVVFGPAPRNLAALPVKVVDGALTVAGNFIGKVGGTQQS